MCIEPPSDSIKNALESGGLLEEAIDAPFMIWFQR
jgi:hypothetical protein